MYVVKPLAKVLAGSLMVAMLLGCTETLEEEIGECEPGVADISTSMPDLPAGC